LKICPDLAVGLLASYFRRMRTSTFVRVALAATTSALAAISQAQPVVRDTGVVAITDRALAPWNNTHGPGCAVGIARAGTVLLTRGYGMADLIGDRPITPNTILESGSVAKQFTSTSILLLMQDGKLSLDDDARKYLPELPVYGRTITVRNLLTHTSGLREWSNLMQWQGWPRGTRVHTQSDVFDVITRQKALNYPVGDFYSYTNSGFLLLRAIVERVSGMPFAQFTAARIFTPLGMTHTRWRDDYTVLVPGLAQAYARRGDTWHLDMPFDNVIGAGGLLTTVGDWLLWNEALTKKSLGAAVGDSITRQMKLTSGVEIQYALGLVVSRYRGTREVAHSGSTAGYSTYLARYPELDNLSIAVMCNASGANATAYAHAIVDGMVPTLPKTPALDSVMVDGATLAMWRGSYRDTRTNTTVTVDTARGALRRGAATMTPMRDGTFAQGATRIRFVAASGAAPVSMRVPTADGDTVVFVRMADRAWVPTAAELASVAGRYRSDEIGVTFTVAATDGRLTLSPRVGIIENLTPTYRDAFDMDGGSAWFTRDAKGRVTAMHFGSGRAWDFVSVRVP
jgi:CubicO group peptidase (beta-lactamase class C family)